jgi:hypothetical protein
MKPECPKCSSGSVERYESASIVRLITDISNGSEVVDEKRRDIIGDEPPSYEYICASCGFQTGNAFEFEPDQDAIEDWYNRRKDRLKGILFSHLGKHYEFSDEKHKTVEEKSPRSTVVVQLEDPSDIDIEQASLLADELCGDYLVPTWDYDDGELTVEAWVKPEDEDDG